MKDGEPVKTELITELIGLRTIFKDTANKALLLEGFNLPAAWGYRSVLTKLATDL